MIEHETVRFYGIRLVAAVIAVILGITLGVQAQNNGLFAVAFVLLGFTIASVVVVLYNVARLAVLDDTDTHHRVRRGDLGSIRKKWAIGYFIVGVLGSATTSAIGRRIDNDSSVVVLSGMVCLLLIALSIREMLVKPASGAVTSRVSDATRSDCDDAKEKSSDGPAG